MSKYDYAIKLLKNDLSFWKNGGAFYDGNGRHIGERRKKNIIAELNSAIEVLRKEGR